MWIGCIYIFPRIFLILCFVLKDKRQEEKENKVPIQYTFLMEILILKRQ